MRQCESKFRLLETAHELIWRQSYGSVGVDQICEHSGVKKGSFYHFFRSKSELTVAAYQYYWEHVRAQLDRIFQSEKPPLERIEAYIDHLRSVQRNQQAKFGRLLGCPFNSLGCELSTQDESIRLMAKEVCEKGCHYLEATLRDAMKAKEIPACDPKALAKEIHCYTTGLTQEAKIANDLAVLDRMKPGVYRLLGIRESVSLA